MKEFRKLHLLLYGYIKQFDTLDINDKKFKDIKNVVSFLNDNFKAIIFYLQKSHLSHNEYSFKFENTPIKNAFGFVASYVQAKMSKLKNDKKSRLVCNLLTTNNSTNYFE